MALYRFLQPHSIGGEYFDAGSIASLPADWVPTPNVEPLDTEAVTAFYAAGPSGRGGGGQTYWIATPLPGNPTVMSYSLTGLGTGLPPVCA